MNMQNSDIDIYVLKANVLWRIYKLKERRFCINMLFDMQTVGLYMCIRLRNALIINIVA